MNKRVIKLAIVSRLNYVRKTDTCIYLPIITFVSDLNSAPLETGRLDLLFLIGIVYDMVM